MPSRRFSLDITTLVNSGAGLGREPSGPHAGRAVFVPGTAPGDRVVVELVRERKRSAEGRVVEFEAPGASRTEPFCPLAGVCGGCAWQHVAPSAQRAAKGEFVRGALRRVPRVEGAADIPDPVALSQTREGVRARARLHLAAGPGGVRVGFRRRGSRALVDVPRCPLLVPAAAERLAQLRQLAQGANVGGGASALITAGDDGPAALSVRTRSGWRPASGAPDHVWRSLPASVGEVGATGGDREPRLRISAEAFSQTHIPGNRALVTELLERWDALPGDPRRTVELFAGGGNLTVPLARAGARGWALERAPVSCEDLRSNVTANGVEGAFAIVESDVMDFEVAERLRQSAPERLVLDPPREGARELMPHIAALKPRAVVYVSCDPATLGRDLEALAEGGYRLQSATPYDLFPETPHVETLAVMTRADDV